jgi:uncharacterized protein
VTDPAGQGDRPWGPATVYLRPLASPLPLGFLGLCFGTVLLSSVQLRWIPVTQSHVVALAILVFTVPVQLIACVYGFLVRDLVAGTAMGLLAGTHAATGLALLTSKPGVTIPGLGLILVMGAVTILIPAIAAAETKVLAALVLGTAACRFVVTAVFELGGGGAWQTAAGVIGVVLGALALYAALAFELEDQSRRTVLPVLRRAAGQTAMTDRLADQVAHVASEAGVRRQL